MGYLTFDDAIDDEPRRWTGNHPDGGRVDVDGVEWFACDPYPTWFRWEGNTLIECEYGYEPKWQYGPDDAIDQEHLIRQRKWSEQTFGPGIRRGVVDHIRKELVEIEEGNLADLGEWVDVVILALDGAWRTGSSPEEIIAAVKAKQAKNERRVWPDWRLSSPDHAIEHVDGIED